jgi:hypothetical protein
METQDVLCPSIDYVLQENCLNLIVVYVEDIKLLYHYINNVKNKVQVML